MDINMVCAIFPSQIMEQVYDADATVSILATICTVLRIGFSGLLITKHLILDTISSTLKWF